MPPFLKSRIGDGANLRRGSAPVVMSRVAEEFEAIRGGLSSAGEAGEGEFPRFSDGHENRGRRFGGAATFLSPWEGQWSGDIPVAVAPGDGG